MKVIWILLGLLSFAAGQAYLFYCLKKMDKLSEKKRNREKKWIADNHCGYSDEDVVE